MAGSKRRPLSPAWRSYILGQTLIVLGAAAMVATESYIPMALAGSAALMLTVPLVRQIAARKRARR
jgi:hypothetical protein